MVIGFIFLLLLMVCCLNLDFFPKLLMRMNVMITILKMVDMNDSDSCVNIDDDDNSNT